MMLLAGATLAIATSLSEVVDDGITGIIVPPNDPAALGAAIRWLRDHPAEAVRLGAAGRARVLDRFTWDRVVRQCLAIYKGTTSPDRMRLAFITSSTCFIALAVRNPLLSVSIPRGTPAVPPPLTQSTYSRRSLADARFHSRLSALSRVG